MIKVKSNLDISYPKAFKALKRYIDPNIINDVNNRESRYDGSHNPLVEIGILKSNNNGYENCLLVLSDWLDLKKIEFGYGVNHGK